MIKIPLKKDKKNYIIINYLDILLLCFLQLFILPITHEFGHYLVASVLELKIVSVDFFFIHHVDVIKTSNNLYTILFFIGGIAMNLMILSISALLIKQRHPEAYLYCFILMAGEVVSDQIDITQISYNLFGTFNYGYGIVLLGTSILVYYVLIRICNRGSCVIRP